MGKMLYLECNSGISGDMTVGALLDLGADRHVLEHALESLGVNGYHLHFGRKSVCGLDAYDFDVHLEEDENGHEHSHDTGMVCGDGPEDDPEDGPGHSHSHHTHTHRNLFDIYQIIDRLESGEQVKALARRMFRIVAEAEAKAHGLPVEQVHFHEVGAVDSIVDIISVAVCVDNLGIDDVVVSALAEGHGYVKCQHGILPVPVPATANITLAHGLDLRFTDNEGEMVTPTGAAIAAALRTRASLPDACRIVKIGMGAGSRVFRQANVLRAMLMEAPDLPQAKITGGNGRCAADRSLDSSSSRWVLETNLDDCSGEILGFTMELLLEAGAADVWYSPIFMKKNRPAYTLSVLCRREEREKMEEIILVHTTTIGIRQYPVARTVLDRKKMTVDTAWGRAEVKVCSYKNRTFYYPEYESVRSICRGTDRDFMGVYQDVRAEAERKGI